MKLQASFIEGYLFYPQLKPISLDIFPRKDIAKDNYLEYIPLTCTLTNNIPDTSLSASFLWDMMVISMLNYQVDQFIEVVVEDMFAHDVEPVKQLVQRLCDKSVSTNGIHRSAHPELGDDHSSGTKKRPHPEDDDEEPKGSKRHLSETNNDVSNDQAAASEPSADLSEVSNTLSAFITHSYTHLHIVHASPHDLDNLLSELRAFLLAHITQIEDKTNFSSQTPPPNFLPHTSPFQNPRRSYFTWIHNTSAIHTSCPYSFAFVKCLMGSA